MSGINDFAFKMATVNGTGSASANSLLMQAIFRMGIPVSGKNLFPSNIQGLPTFYEIRASKDGYTARPQEVDLVVALNPATYAKDVATVRPGGYPVVRFVVADGARSRARRASRFWAIPFGRMCVENFETDRDRTLLRNIVYVGALAALLEIDMDIVAQMLVEKFSKKKRLYDANNTAIKLGYDYAKRTTRVRCRSSGKDGCDKRLRDHRWQYSGGAGCAVCRSNSGRVVSDHAVHIVDGCVQRVLRKVSG